GGFPIQRAKGRGRRQVRHGPYSRSGPSAHLAATVRRGWRWVHGTAIGAIAWTRVGQRSRAASKRLTNWPENWSWFRSPNSRNGSQNSGGGRNKQVTDSWFYSVPCCVK